MIFYVIVSVVVSTITYAICELIHLPLVLTVVVRLFICCVISNLLFLICYFKLPEFSQCIELVNNMTKGKLGIILRRFK